MQDYGCLTALMLQAQAGDEAAYRELLESLYPLIFRRCKKLLPTDECAEDCTQEALMAIHRMRHTYRPEKPLEAWVRFIVKNKVIDAYRKLSSKGAGSVTHVHREEPVSKEKFDRALEDRELLQEMLGALSESFRTPFIMTRVFGYSVQETSEELGISESLVKVRTHRASRQLQQQCERAELAPL